MCLSLPRCLLAHALAVVPRPRVRVGVAVLAELSHSLVDKITQKGKSGVG